MKPSAIARRDTVASAASMALRDPRSIGVKTVIIRL